MIGIVGAGIGGLALDHYLRAAGVETQVWEASDEAGGVVRSASHEGLPLEQGPQRLRLTPGIRDLADAAGVADDLLTAPDLPLYGYRDGSLAEMPLSPSAALRTDLLSWRGKARVLLEPVVGGVREGETVGEFLRRSFGDEATEYCFGPLYAGLYASDPDEMPVEHSLAKALDHAGVERSVLVTALRKRVRGGERPPMASVEGGLQRLPSGLAADTEVAFQTPVEDVASAGDGYRVRTATGETRVDELVVTTAAGVASDMLDAVASDAAARLSRLTYNPLAVVHLRTDWTFDGAGVKVPDYEPFRTRGLTAHGPLFDREGLVTAFLGGSHAPDVVEWDDERLRETARREFRALTGADAEGLAVARVTPGMPAYDRSWDALDGLALPDGIHLCTNYVARAGVPGRVRQARALAERIAERENETAGRRSRPVDGAL